MTQLQEIFNTEKPLIGTLHIDPLPGSPRWQGNIEATILKAEQEALALASGNINALLVESHVSSQQKTLDPSAISLLSVIIKRIHRLTQLPVGISVLENDAVSALSVAYSTESQFIRVPLLVGASLGKYGWNEGCVAQLEARYQELYGNLDRELPIPVLADVSLAQELPGQPTQSRKDSGNTITSDSLTAMAKAVLNRCPWVNGFIVSAKEVNNINLMNLKKFLNQSTQQPVFVLDNLIQDTDETIQAEQLLPALLHQAGGVILDTSTRKASITENWGQSTIDAAKVESLVRHLRDEKSIEALGKEYFLNQM